MDLSTSCHTAVPADVLARYDWRETRNAASIIRHTNGPEFDDLLTVLRQFRLDAATDILVAGGNESKTASRLNKAFRVLGWREATYSVQLSSALTLLPFADPETKKFGTATTTNLTNTISRLTRGDGGGCPILVASICARTV